MLVVVLLIATATARGQDKGFVGLTASPGGAFGLGGAKVLSTHWTLGLELQFAYTVQKEYTTIGSLGQGGTITIEERESTEEWSIAPFVRYGLTLSKRWSGFAQLRTPVTRGYRSSFTNISDRLQPIESRTFTAGVNLGPGVQFKVSEHWAMTADMAVFGYEYESIDKGSSQTAFNFDLGPQAFNLGFNRMF